MRDRLLTVFLLGVILLILLSVSARGATLTWDPVTTYTDNTTIGSEAGGIFYNVEMDGVVTATKVAGTSWLVPTVPKKTAHAFRAQTVLGTGEVSEWSPPLSWTSPAGNPKTPGRVRMLP